MSTPNQAEPASADQLVILAADDAAICVDDLCLPPDVRPETVADAEDEPVPKA